MIFKGEQTMKKWMVLLICVGMLWPFSAPGAPGPKYLIYIVNSYNPETFGWTVEENTGIIKGFEKQGLKQGIHYDVISATMDALVKSSKDEMKAEAARILADIKAKKPDLVMTTDDDALQWVGLKIEKTPVVFNGINEIGDYVGLPQIDSLEKPGHNLTGVYQTTYFKQSLEFIQQLVPNAKTFAVITCKDTTSFALMKDLETQRENLPLAWKDKLMSEKFSEWQAKILEWQEKVDAIFVLSNNSVQDEQGNILPSKTVTEWIVEHSRLPDTVPWAYQVQEGILVSASDSGELQGVHAALLAAEILKGATPGSLSIMTPPNGVPVLNGKRAEKLKLTIPSDLLTMFIESGQVFE
jgi:putative ABC transport system substrate-binding protein